MHSKLILPVLICLFLISCSQEELDDSHKIYPVNLDKAVSNKPLSDLFEDLQFVILKADSENPLVSPYQFQFRNGKIYVRDLDTNNIQIFSTQGNYQGGIFSSGKGPKEFFQINDYFVTENQIIIQDTFLRKLLIFDREGNFIQEKRHLINNSNFAVSEDRFLLYMANDPEFDSHNYLIQEDGSILSQLQKIEGEFINSGKYTQANSFIPLDQSKFLFYRPYTFQINFLDLKKQTLYQTVAFDFGKDQLSPENRFLPSNEKNRIIVEKNLVSQLISVLPTKSGVLISFFRGNKERFTLFLKNDLSGFSLYSDLQNDLIPLKLNFPWTTDGERIYFVLNSIDFYNQYVESFAGLSVGVEEGNIHDFFQKNRDELVDDQTVLVSMKVREDISTQERD